MPWCVCGTCLQPLRGEHLSFTTANREDSAQLDVRACGLWGLRQQSAFSDVWAFNPCAPSCRGTQMDVCYRRHERKERQTYEQHVCEVKWGSITPLAFSTSGGMGRVATVTYKSLASLLATKWEAPYSIIMGWLRCQLSFSRLRSVVVCLRDSRSARNHVPCNSMDVAAHKWRIPLVGWTTY